MEDVSVPFLFIVLFLLAVLLFASVRIVREFERGIVYTFGKYTGSREPGIQLVLPAIQQMVLIDMRLRTVDIPPQDVISKDNVSVKVNAVVNYRIVNPAHAINRVEDFMFTTSQLAQTSLRSVVGKHELDEILSKRDELSRDIQESLDAQTEGWGIKVVDVNVKDVDLDPSMIRAIARQAEAERERRAKIINSEGELQAAQKLDEAATILAQRPETMQLRYLGTMGEFVNAKGSTIVLPLPLDIVKVGLEALAGRK